MLGRCSDRAGETGPTKQSRPTRAGRPESADGAGGEKVADASCVFCEIVAGVRPAHEVWRDDAVVAFLDHSPLFEGHVLVVPSTHFETLADLPGRRLEHYFAIVQMISASLPGAMAAQGTLVVMNNSVSQSVPHLHAHVVPRTRGDGLRGFFWPRTRYADETAAATVAARISDALAVGPAHGSSAQRSSPQGASGYGVEPLDPEDRDAGRL